MTNAERFVEKYKRLEKAVRTAYRLKDRDSIRSTVTFARLWRKCG